MRQAIDRLRVDRRRLLGIVLALTAAGLALAATRTDPTVDVLVAGRDLAPGSALPADAVIRRAVLDPSGLVTADTDLDGTVLRSPLAAGEPLLPSLLIDAAAPDPAAAVGLELPTASGVLGRLVPGDRVDVHLTGTEPPTVVVARGVLVLELSDPDELGTDRSVRVLLGTDTDTAADIAGSAHRGSIDLVRVSR